MLRIRRHNKQDSEIDILQIQRRRAECMSLQPLRLVSVTRDCETKHTSIMNIKKLALAAHYKHPALP